MIRTYRSYSLPRGTPVSFYTLGHDPPGLVLLRTNPFLSDPSGTSLPLDRNQTVTRDLTIVNT